MIGASQTKNSFLSSLKLISNDSQFSAPSQETLLQTAREMAQAIILPEVTSPQAIAAAGSWNSPDDSNDYLTGYLTEEREASIEQSLRQALCTQHFLEDLIDCELVRTGRFKPNLEKIDLSLVAREAVEDFAPMIKDRPLYSDGDPAFILGDRQRIHRLFFHLLLNASQHSDPETEIKVDVWRRGTHVCLFVQDQGRHPLTDELESLFSSTPSTDLERNPADRDATNANRLSLVSVKRIVSCHGATISVQRAARNGTVFHVSFKALQ